MLDPSRRYREIVNAVLYLLRSGCAWLLLLHDMPPWKPCIIIFVCRGRIDSGNGFILSGWMRAVTAKGRVRTGLRKRSDGPRRSSSILQNPAIFGSRKESSLIGTRLWREKQKWSRSP